jgi:hypothetical protein
MPNSTKQIQRQNTGGMGIGGVGGMSMGGGMGLNVGNAQDQMQSQARMAKERRNGK